MPCRTPTNARGARPIDESEPLRLSPPAKTHSFAQNANEWGTRLFGVGLVLFDLDKDNPNFEIRMRAQRSSPDMFYVNEFADRLKSHDPDKFQKLFG
jgi:hypothetical protein